MSLIADLRAAAHALDPQFQVTTNEVQGVLSALVHYSQYGDEFLHAAEKGIADVGELIAPKPKEDPATAPASPVPTVAPPPGTSAVEAAASPVPTVAELEAQISDMQAQLDARRAVEQQTQVQHETGAAATDPAAAAAPAPASTEPAPAATEPAPPQAAG